MLIRSPPYRRRLVLVVRPTNFREGRNFARFSTMESAVSVHILTHKEYFSICNMSQRKISTEFVT
jgi:hypothetical protein